MDFLKTGYDPLISDDRADEREFYRKVVSLMSILCEEALKSGAKFAETCGRRKIVERDIVLALKYESHAFWEKDIDDRFIEKLAEERRHTYDTESDESEADEAEDEAEADEAEADEADEAEEYTTEFVSGDYAFHSRVTSIDRSWIDWNPDDPVKRLLKAAIEKSEHRLGDEAPACTPACHASRRALQGAKDSR